MQTGAVDPRFAAVVRPTATAMTTLPPHGNVLLICDDADRGELLVRRVRGCGARPVRVSGRETFLLAEGEDDTVDLVVLDIDHDHEEARDLFRRIAHHEVFPGVPRLYLVRDREARDRVLGATPGNDAVAMVRADGMEGFDDRVRLGSEVGRLRRALFRSSIRDDLSGLFNREYLLLRLEQEFSRARRYRTPLSLIVFDIDQLHRVNTRFAESVGNEVIRRFAVLLDRHCRKEDLLGRAGEESFWFLLPGSHYRGAAVVANKVRTETAALGVSSGREPVEVRTSAGISTYPDNRSIERPEQLLAAAERALQQAKARGGNRVYIDEAVLGGRGGTVVVVDPDPHLLDLAESLLAADDFEVVGAHDVAGAIEAVRGVDPSLLIVDLRMRDPETGRLALDRIRDVLPTPVPVIGLTHGEVPTDAEGGRPAVDRLVSKPFSVSVLRHLARELLGGPRTAPG